MSKDEELKKLRTERKAAVDKFFSMQPYERLTCKEKQVLKEKMLLMNSLDTQIKSLIIEDIQEKILIADDRENLHDGYHTFKELYEFRKMYNKCLFNEWYRSGLYNIHKSKRHHDGELCFGGGWFIVNAMLPGGLVSNHYELKDFDLFECLETYEALYPYDGHTSTDVLARLKKV